MGFLHTSEQKATSSNQAYPYLQGALGGSVTAGSNATNLLSSLLSGGAAGQQGLKGFQDSSGYGNQLDSMSRAITGNQAANGLLRSGSTGTAIQTGADNLANQSFSNYLGQLTGLAGIGNQAASTIGGAGQTSYSKGWDNSQSGVSGLGALSAGLSLLSDRRSKRDIERIGEMEDGLGIYEYRYLGYTDRHIGVMADEVALLRPWALGPEIGGWRTVNYGAL